MQPWLPSRAVRQWRRRIRFAGRPPWIPVVGAPPVEPDLSPVSSLRPEQLAELDRLAPRPGFYDGREFAVLAGELWDPDDPALTATGRDEYAQSVLTYLLREAQRRGTYDRNGVREPLCLQTTAGWQCRIAQLPGLDYLDLPVALPALIEADRGAAQGIPDFVRQASFFPTSWVSWLASGARALAALPAGASDQDRHNALVRALTAPDNPSGFFGPGFQPSIDQAANDPANLWIQFLRVVRWMQQPRTDRSVWRAPAGTDSVDIVTTSQWPAPVDAGQWVPQYVKAAWDDRARVALQLALANQAPATTPEARTAVRQQLTSIKAEAARLAEEQLQAQARSLVRPLRYTSPADDSFELARYLAGEARRHGVPVWSLPGLADLEPPWPGLRQLAVTNPWAWLETLERIWQAGQAGGHDFMLELAALWERGRALADQDAGRRATLADSLPGWRDSSLLASLAALMNEAGGEPHPDRLFEWAWARGQNGCVRSDLVCQVRAYIAAAASPEAWAANVDGNPALAALTERARAFGQGVESAVRAAAEEDERQRVANLAELGRETARQQKIRVAQDLMVRRKLEQAGLPSEPSPCRLPLPLVGTVGLPGWTPVAAGATVSVLSWALLGLIPTGQSQVLASAKGLAGVGLGTWTWYSMSRACGMEDRARSQLWTVLLVAGGAAALGAWLWAGRRHEAPEPAPFAKAEPAEDLEDDQRR